MEKGESQFNDETISSFNSRFLKDFGKDLFRRAYFDRSTEVNLILKAPKNRLVDPWRYLYLHGSKDGFINQTGWKYLGIQSPDIDLNDMPPTISATAFANAYGSIVEKLDELLQVSKITVASDALSKGDLTLCTIDWAQPCNSSEFDLNRLLGWLSDSSVYDFTDPVFSYIRDHINANHKRIKMFAHTAYFWDEVFESDIESDNKEIIRTALHELGKTEFNTPCDDELPEGLDPSRRIPGLIYAEELENLSIDPPSCQDGYGPTRKYFLVGYKFAKKYLAFAPLQLNRSCLDFIFVVNGYQVISQNSGDPNIIALEITW